MMSEYGLKLKPQEFFCIQFSDETAEERTEEELDAMMQKIRDAVSEYGYDISSYGESEKFKRFLCGEKE